MKDLYPIAGISKQGYFKQLKSSTRVEQISKTVVEQFNQIRRDHRRMSCRKMYYVEGSNFPVGRDIVEQIGFANGFKVKIKRNPVKTTWSQRVEVFPNLVEGITVNNINQVWQSDIFYLPVCGKHYYGVVIEDVYSKKLLSLVLSNTLQASQTNKALRKAIFCAGVKNVKNCIFHTDRGTQYISEAQKSLIKQYKMRQSMCKLPQENAYVERLNGILKQEYFDYLELNPGNIQKLATRIRYLYNNQRPHRSITNLSPARFEQQLMKCGENQRPEIRIYKWNNDLSTKKEVINKEKRSKKEILPNT